ncbi:GRAM domain-containing protein 2B-like isoform X3 [Amphibalanus amphitrite]|uniref:GRAM domain-containing protein 2B-like isoform X3 n=1 Tax=Amphibalanus amphitrite TaxID=1232801 RepID=UPI001C90914A|nr:GRAM domain-containing protein 2B-like isoform X3 [Amphibalanus amphitrite]
MRRLSRSMANIPAALFPSSTSLSASTTTLSSSETEPRRSADTGAAPIVAEDDELPIMGDDPGPDPGAELDEEEANEVDDFSDGVVTRYFEDARYIRRKRHALRNLSRSTPTMNRLESQTSFEVPRSQRKFLRRFKDLDAHEKIIKSFSCALVSDILLQGRLYVTSHHFAFYSNLFGHVTRILIPCSLVLDITKERTARIIPNAVAILSSEGRHVFGSLLSRDSAFETLVRVWRKEIGHDEADACGNDKEDGLDDDVPLLPSVGVDVSDSTATEENDSALDFTASPAATIELTPGGASVRLESVPVRSVAPPAPSPSAVSLSSLLGGGLSSLFAWLSGNSTAHRSTLLLLFCNLLLLLIFCSSYASLSRMEEIQRRIESPYQRVETQESLEEAERTLNLHLQQLAMVRKSLESLSSLTMSGHPGGDST